MVYQVNRGEFCHSVNSVGANVGLALNGLSRRRSRSWVAQHFADPKKLTPNTIMPAYKLAGRELANLTEYIFSLEDAP